MTGETSFSKKRYVGINCNQFGRFVGKNGYISTDASELSGETVVNYALCSRCKRAQDVMPS